MYAKNARSNRAGAFTKYSKVQRAATTNALRGTVAVPPRSVLNSLVKNLMKSTRETKMFQVITGLKVMYPYSASTGFYQNNQIPLGPWSGQDMVQGVGSSDRIGNKIRVKKVTLNLIMYPRPYDANTNATPANHDIRLLIVHSKNNPTDTVVSSTFFETNNGTTSPQDNLQDMMYTVNPDVYVVSHDRRFKLGTSKNSGTGSDAAAQFFSNNDYKYNQIIKMDITKSFPTVITWNDTSNVPTSFSPTMILLQAPADGTTTNIAAVLNNYWAQVIMEYTDA